MGCKRKQELRRPSFFYDLCRKLADETGADEVAVSKFNIELPENVGRDNPTGFAGINIRVKVRRTNTKSLVALFYQATFTDEDRVQHARAFSMRAHGHARSYNEAIKARAKMIGYTSPIPSLKPPAQVDIIRYLKTLRGVEWVNENLSCIEAAIKEDCPKAVAV